VEWYFLKAIGWALLACAAFALWAVPDPIGKLRELWIFGEANDVFTFDDGRLKHTLKIAFVTATKSTVYAPDSTLKITLLYAKIRTAQVTPN